MCVDVNKVLLPEGRAESYLRRDFSLNLFPRKDTRISS